MRNSKFWFQQFEVRWALDGPPLRIQKKRIYYNRMSFQFYIEGHFELFQTGFEVKIPKFKMATFILWLKLWTFFDYHKNSKHTFFLKFNALEV